ncbi:exodeoxyribonuclease III [Candidatus Kinetoplastibacterium oncopeltii TCC290E]|uniref:Exodeoxyribonuclease III n=1 Tax=Candidatus Kinetoplastidibacterium stringomonadis TCC290E TaxID=1208920 RepID=M1L7T4_9PROT|nr:exodeoxyribonuclease III [Candidatus Kinetoplastibacterium oncopeltii]AGF48643.1 exodeoxyribonuclease III [Candidatus Kinetoplastibacterium oncopeltii TCC290E]
MLKITSINLNGIRSAIRKGFVNWLKIQKPDIVCMQETRISYNDLNDDIINPLIYEGHFFCAEKKGYSGVGIYSSIKPQSIIKGMGNKEFDCEGRLIRINLENLSIINAYFPSGTSGENRQHAKFRFLEDFELLLDKIYYENRNYNREFILCGDWNIAHKEIDIKNWKNNTKNSGFLPEERNWISKIIKKYNLLDVFRELNHDSDQYTWWSNRNKSWEKNVGWRIDYQFATNNIAKLAINYEIYKENRFSDHAPLSISYNFKI